MILPCSDRPQSIFVFIQLVGPQLIDVRQIVSDVDGRQILTPIQILDILIRQFRSTPIVE